MGRHQRAETGGLLCALIAAVASWAGMRLYLDYAPSQWLVASRMFLTCAGFVALCAVIAFMLGYARLSGSWSLSRGWWVPVRRLFEVLSLSVVYASTVLLASFVLLNVVYTMIGIQLGGDYLVALVTGASGIMGYFGYVQGQLLTAKTVASLLPLFVLSGVGTAGLTTDDPNWWRNNFSQLGDNVTFAASMFNATLVMAGICVIIISYFAVYELIASHQQYVEWRHHAHLPVDLAESAGDDDDDAVSGDNDGSGGNDHGAENSDAEAEQLPPRLVHDKTATLSHFRLRTTILLVLLVLSGIFLAGVGIFRYTPHPLMHNMCARGMMFPMCVLLLAIPWLAPQLSKMVFVVSDLILVVISVSGVMWTQGRTSLTNVEALTWILFMAWFVVFSRQIAALESDRMWAQLKYDDGSKIQSRLSPNK
ncbi:MAG: ABC transporter permease [Bifidobacteriaceae bacterium]|nr:ABC transporter permease [Bifidobacteriaceae bacterium]MCI1978545.1 ABC transporter permease [Bifidobacteriaceae bacterium]